MEWLAVALEYEEPSKAAASLTALPPEKAGAVVGYMKPVRVGALMNEMDLRRAADLDGYLTSPQAAVAVSAMRPARAAQMLRLMKPESVYSTLGMMEPSRVAAVLNHMDPPLVAGLLSRMNQVQAERAREALANGTSSLGPAHDLMQALGGLRTARNAADSQVRDSAVRQVLSIVRHRWLSETERLMTAEALVAFGAPEPSEGVRRLCNWILKDDLGEDGIPPLLRLEGQ